MLYTQHVAHFHTITFTGGYKHGYTAKQATPLPQVLVIQGHIAGRFRVLDYVRIGNTTTYRYAAARTHTATN